MGTHPHITATDFPTQTPDVGSRVLVCFHYDTSRRFPGTVVREDLTHPYVMIIRLDDGRFVLSTECQYQPIEPR